MSRGQEKIFSTLGPKLRGSKVQQDHGDKLLQIRIEPIDYKDDGTKTTLTNWILNPRQPSGDGSFVEMFAQKEYAGKWNDLRSYHRRGVVCQYQI